MSRSTKKPFYKDSTPGAKRQANSRVRKTKEIADGKSYRKVFCSWNISDWCFYTPKDKKASRK